MSGLEYQEGRTELNELGEFALIERLTDGFEPRRPNTIKGVGDDCAVTGAGKVKTLISMNSLAEGVDFDMMYTPLKHLGYKAVAVAISNIAAMNGTPTHIEVGVSVSNRYSVEALEELYAGIRLCCERYDVDLVGGNIGSSRSGMVLTVTAIGEADEGKITYRNGAKCHDKIFVFLRSGTFLSGPDCF